MKQLVGVLGLIVVLLSVVLFMQASTNSDAPERPMPRSAPARSIQFIAAGVPQTPDPRAAAETVFAQLASQNIRIFYPTFQTQELPETLSLGYEEDFLLPCTEPRPVHQALQAAGVKLLIPAELFYQREPLPPLSEDLLAALIACTGRDQVAGVTSYDEPVHTGASLERVRELYQRVKEIDATLPVLMVHAPVWADTDGTKTERERQQYLAAVKIYSQYADVAGFNVYGIPADIAKVTSPYANGTELAYDRAIEDYLLWLQRELPDHEHLMVYQGFAFADHYSAAAQAEAPPEVLARALIAPSRGEQETMVALAQQYGVSYVAWWGQSMSPTPTPAWQAILEVTAGYAE